MVVGEHDLSTSAETSRTRQYEVDRIVVHTNQSGDPSKVDLALIRSLSTLLYVCQSQTWMCSMEM